MTTRRWRVWIISLLLCAILPGVGFSARAKKVAASSTHPVVNQNGHLVGGTLDGKWLSSRQMAPHLKGNEKYKLYSDDKLTGTAIGGFADKNLFVKMRPEALGKFAVRADWNPIPRTPRETAVIAAHKQAVASIIKKMGIKSRVQISKVLSVDISGKGEKVGIISAALWDDEIGDYSLLALMSTEKGKPTTRLIVGSFRKPDDKHSVPIYYNLNGLKDLDGDGRLEIVVDCAVPLLESYGTEIYRYDEGKTRLVVAVRPNYDYNIK